MAFLGNCFQESAASLAVNGKYTSLSDSFVEVEAAEICKFVFFFVCLKSCHDLAMTSTFIFDLALLCSGSISSSCCSHLGYLFIAHMS